MTIHTQHNGNRIPEIVRSFMEVNGYSYRKLAAKLSETFPITHLPIFLWAKGESRPRKSYLEFVHENAEDETITKFIEDMLKAIGA